MCLEAVSEQYIQPLTMALGTLTALACQDRTTAEAVSSTLREQAESCPSDVAGRIILLKLSELAAGPVSPDPGATSEALRNALRLIHGGKPNPDA